MKNKGAIIVVLFIGWAAGAGSWHFIVGDQGAVSEQGMAGTLSSVSNSLAGGEEGERVAVSPLPVGPVDLQEVSGQAALPPAVLEVPPDMSAFLLEGGDEAGFSADDGVEQDTGEFIDADDPQAYVAYLNAHSDGDTVQDTGEFIDVENPSAYAGSDSPPRDTGEFIDVDDPRAYAAYWDGLSDGVVRDTGEFIAVDAGLVP